MSTHPNGPPPRDDGKEIILITGDEVETYRGVAKFALQISADSLAEQSVKFSADPGFLAESKDFQKGYLRAVADVLAMLEQAVKSADRLQFEIHRVP